MKLAEALQERADAKRLMLRLCYNLLMRFLAFLLLLYLSKNKKSRKALILPGFSAVHLAPPARIELTTNP